MPPPSATRPSSGSKYREAFAPSKAKDDPTDAELALELLLCHREALTCLTPQTAPMRALVQLVCDRRAWSTTRSASRID